jgi:hypothetical protein
MVYKTIAYRGKVRGSLLFFFLKVNIQHIQRQLSSLSIRTKDIKKVQKLYRKRPTFKLVVLKEFHVFKSDQTCDVYFNNDYY